MDPTSLLAQLRDVHEPTTISWWPLAFGWWILILCSISLAVGLIFVLVRWHRNKAWRRSALKEYKALRNNYLRTPNPENLAQINTLLKRSISSARNDHRYMASIQEDWACTLRNPDKKKLKEILQDQEIFLLSSAHYMPQCNQLESASLQRIEKWIKSLK